MVKEVVTIMAALVALSPNVRQVDGLSWTLTNGNGSIEVEGSVPGGVYTDLMAANILNEGDFYYRYNDFTYRWVGNENWTYSTTLTVEGDVAEHERVALVFEGLDTSAEVFVNGQSVGVANNMFVKYVFDIKEQLGQDTTADLEVRFESPVEYAQRKYNTQAASYIVPPKCVDPAFKGECHANHIRKMQASFSWDWGPAFPNLGIWKSWQMVGWSSLHVSDVMFTATPTEALPNVPDPSFKPGWKVTIKMYCDAAIKKGEVNGSVSVVLADSYFTTAPITTIVDNYVAVLQLTINLDQGHVEMWWPNGYGSQPLYQLTVQWTNALKTENSSKSMQVGFRTVELNQDFVDSNDKSKGRHYRVIVNNVTMFMKGSNWIPAHVLPEMVTPEYTRELLLAAADTHQNCIRVWGGGIYETDEFYEIADELGILIWQDFMFACSMYPVDQDFLDTVTQEVVTQVKRLQHHPSILLWAGNNENEAALRGNWYGTASNFEQYKRDYVKLYVDTIRTATQDLDDSRPFVVSSPNNGIESEEEGHVAEHPYNTLYGDVHYYNYLSDAWMGQRTPRTRFASEYGFQSWPVFRTMKDVSEKEDWSRGSSLMYHRQHHPGGQEELALQIGLHMHIPPQDGSEKAFKDYLYLSQIHQAVAIKVETEFYRRGMSEINSKGEGYTMGALYWQLNDIWQGASWASIEYGGRWKMLHYYVKNFFDPILVSMYMEQEMVKIYVVSDEVQPVDNLMLAIDLHRYDQWERVNRKTVNMTMDPTRAQLVASLDMWDDLAMDQHCTQHIYDEADVCFLVSHLYHNGQTLAAPDNFLLMGKPKDAHLAPADVKILEISEPIETSKSNWTFTISLSSNNIALFVWLEVDQAGVFSDNGFLMYNPTKEVMFYAKEETTAADVQTSIEVTSLTDTYTKSTVNKNLVDRAFHPNDIRNIIHFDTNNGGD